MIGVRSAELKDRSRQRRLLSVGAGVVAASAWAGALGLASGADPYLRHLTDQLPFRSPVLGAAALSAIVGVPYSVLALQAWRGGPGVDQTAVLSGGLSIGWILVEAIILEESSFWSRCTRRLAPPQSPLDTDG